MSSITNTTSNKAQTTIFADVQKFPTILPKALSFLSAGDLQCARLCCKKWDIAAAHSTQNITNPIVENGYGDFLLIDTTGKEIDASLYRKVFPLLNGHLPQVHQKPLKDRLQTVNACLHEKFPEHPSLKAVFIPRTLYELFYLLETYEEELQNANNLQHMQCDKSRYCCHRFFFQGKGSEQNLDDQVVGIAHRLNSFIVKNLKLRDKGMTESEFQNAGKSILEQFQVLNQKSIDEDSLEERWRVHVPILRKVRKGVIIDPLNLKTIIALECSKTAQTAIILYRGSLYQKEPQFSKGNPYTVSFGISPFAGYINDIGACAAGRIFYDKNTIFSYALPIPLQSDWKEVFDIPAVNTICGLNAKGELFHARAKCPKAEDSISGFDGHLEPEIRSRLVASLSNDQLQAALDSYQAKRIAIIPDPLRKTGSTKSDMALSNDPED